MKTVATIALCIWALPLFANAATKQVDVHKVDESGVGEHIGQVKISEDEHGLVFHPDLRDLPPGQRGFHVHEHGSCEPSRNNDSVTPAGAAGSHYDPQDAGHHGKPWGDGHRGDLPALFVDEDGRARHPVLSPRLTLDDVAGRALMIHAGGDNYADDPAPLGGGGPRIACGVIE